MPSEQESSASMSQAKDLAIAAAIKGLQDSGKLCDLALSIKGRSFLAHKAVLAAQSASFREYLKTSPPSAASSGAGTASKDDPMSGALSLTTPSTVAAVAAASAPTQESAAPATEPPTTSRMELQVHGVTSPEAVQVMLDYMYADGGGAAWKYDPRTAAVNMDVLRLAKNFRLQRLHEMAARHLVKGLTTENAVGRLVLCEEHNIPVLREKIVEALTSQQSALMAVASGEEIQKHPRILQELLSRVAAQRIASTPPADETPPQPQAPQQPSAEKEKPAPPTKRARKGAGA